MFLRTLLALLGCVLTPQALAQAYPSKPIRLLVGYPPGGSGDFTTRIIGAELSEGLGVAVVVENRPGAGGNIAAELVSKAAPDGYTLLNGNNHAINLTLYKNPGYRDEDFAPITKVAAGPTVIVVNKDAPYQSLRELIDYAKANPGRLFNAGAGYGSAPHLAAALFESVAGVKFTSVQFKGGGPAAQSLIAGDTQVMFATSPTVTGFIQGGRMRALAVSKRTASPAIPGIPGAEEAGLPNYEYTFWFGLYAPAGTPREVIARVHAAAVRGLARPEVQKRIASQGMDAAPFPSPEAFAADIRAEAPSLVKIIQDAGAKVE